MGDILPAVRLVSCAIAVLGSACTASGTGETGRVLRVCADPNGLPFSDERAEGFENRIAALLADELNATVRYTWHPHWRGFIRKTLTAGECDLVMGVPSSFELALAGRPYYRSSYVFVYRQDLSTPVQSLDDPILRELRIGVHLIGDDYTNTPPAHALANRGIVENVRGYMIYGDYARPTPAAAIIEDLAEGVIDVAIVWGPIAGYFASRQPVPLAIAPVTPRVDPPVLSFVYDISLGVRRGESELLSELEAAMDRRRNEVEGILDEFGVPRPYGRPDPRTAEHVEVRPAG